MFRIVQAVSVDGKKLAARVVYLNDKYDLPDETYEFRQDLLEQGLITRAHNPVFKLVSIREKRNPHRTSTLTKWYVQIPVGA